MPVLIAVIVVLVAAIGLWFWFNRPIHPVRLSAEEKAVVQQKVEAIQQPQSQPSQPKPAEPTYEKGKREILLTEYELNGLLNEHTTLGDKLKFELATDAVHARFETDLDPDLPVFGGKKLKARARFLIKQDETGPHLVLDDLTVWGVSVPNDWLGQLKGRDLLGETLGGERGKIGGVEEIKVEPGQLRILLKE